MLLQLSWRHLVKKIRNGLYQSRALLSRTVDVLRMCILNFWEIYFTISAIKTYSRDTRFHLDLAHVCSVRVPWPCLAHAYFERVCIFSLFCHENLLPRHLVLFDLARYGYRDHVYSYPEPVRNLPSVFLPHKRSLATLGSIGSRALRLLNVNMPCSSAFEIYETFT